MNQPLPSADLPGLPPDGTAAFEQLLLKLAARFVGVGSGSIDDSLPTAFGRSSRPSISTEARCGSRPAL